MGGRKRPLPLISELEITGAAAEGKAIGKHEDRIVFVPFAVPGDIIEAQVFKKKKNFFEARITKLIKPSPERIEPICSHFGVCGGCKWQNLSYENQLKFKQKQVADNLTRIGKIELPEITPIRGSSKSTFYRNKLEYTFSYSRWVTQEEIQNESEIKERRGVGFHIPGMFDKVLDVDTCYLQSEDSNLIRNFIRSFGFEHNLSFYNVREHVGLLRNLIIRNSNRNDLMVIMSFGADEKENILLLMNALKENFPQITSLNYVVNTKMNDTLYDQDIICFDGSDHMIEEMEGLNFKIGPKSFFQTNSSQALELYRITREFAELASDDIVYDLYTGTGTIANFIAKSVSKVVGIESVPEAIEDAKVNSELNGISNTTFVAGDMMKILDEEFIQANGFPSVIITDPPRAGMHEKVTQQILNSGAKMIVYVSCNPATQARDLAILDEKYKVTKVQPVDMFPHTHHVENVVQLKLK